MILIHTLFTMGSLVMTSSLSILFTLKSYNTQKKQKGLYNADTNNNHR